MGDDTPPRPSHLRPGYDERDPHLDRERDDLPSWWRENAAVFDEHRMRPYRPPTFLDGSYVPALVDELEAKLDVEIRIRKRIASTAESDWEVLVDGTVAALLERKRNEEGRSVYQIGGGAFVECVSDAVDS